MSRILLMGATAAVFMVTVSAQGIGSPLNVDDRSIVPLPAEIGADTVTEVQKLWIGDVMARILSDQPATNGRSVSKDVPSTR